MSPEPHLDAAGQPAASRYASPGRVTLPGANDRALPGANDRPVDARTSPRHERRSERRARWRPVAGRRRR